MTNYTNQNQFGHSFSESGIPLENMSMLSTTMNHVIPFNQQNSSTLNIDQDNNIVQDKELSAGFTQFINMLHRQHGRETRRLPRVGRKELDLYSLYMAVQKRGGYNAILQWKELGIDLGLPNTVTNAGYILRTKYEQFILPFEGYILQKYPPFRTKNQDTSQADDETWIKPYQNITNKHQSTQEFFENQQVNMPKQMSQQQPQQFGSKLTKLFIKDFPFTDETFEKIISQHRNITDLEIGTLENLTKMPRVTVFPQQLTRLVLYNVPQLLADQFLLGISNLQLQEFNITVCPKGKADQQIKENRVERYQNISSFPSSID